MQPAVSVSRLNAAAAWDGEYMQLGALGLVWSADADQISRRYQYSPHRGGISSDVLGS